MLTQHNVNANISSTSEILANVQIDSRARHSCQDFAVTPFIYLYRQPQNYTCNGTKLRHSLSSVYSVTTPLHVSGLLLAIIVEVQCMNKLNFMLKGSGSRIIYWSFNRFWQ
jgi:hypothetical protein